MDSVAKLFRLWIQLLAVVPTVTEILKKYPRFQDIDVSVSFVLRENLYFFLLVYYVTTRQQTTFGKGVGVQ